MKLKIWALEGGTSAHKKRRWKTSQAIVLGKILQGFLLEGITLDSSDQSNQEVTKMPLYASHERNGEKLVKNWSPDEVSVMCAIAEDEGNNLPSTGYHIVVNDYQADGYRTGDILRLWR